MEEAICIQPVHLDGDILEQTFQTIDKQDRPYLPKATVHGTGSVTVCASAVVPSGPEGTSTQQRAWQGIL